MKTESKLEKSIDLSAVPDSVLFEAAANRLRSVYQKIHGIDFTFGFFSFVFHSGKFQGIEETSKLRLYQSNLGYSPL